MHREMRGEKSIEIRLEDVKLLEDSLFPDYQKGVGSAGIVTISIWRATEGQMFHLRRVIEDHPGDYEILLQIVNGGGTTPIYLSHHVNPTDTFKRAISEGLSRCELEVDHFEAA